MNGTPVPHPVRTPETRNGAYKEKTMRILMKIKVGPSTYSIIGSHAGGPTMSFYGRETHTGTSISVRENTGNPRKTWFHLNLKTFGKV